ncbi:MAG: hypothetical protein ACUZ8H_03940, partial [Candidatus Anammoxibacter sp.]
VTAPLILAQFFNYSGPNRIQMYIQTQIMSVRFVSYYNTLKSSLKKMATAIVFAIVINAVGCLYPLDNSGNVLVY